MAITKPVRPKTTEGFISGAPDAQAKGVRRGTKQQITLTIAPDLLAKVDELAEKMGQSRAALINLAIYRTVESGL
jgi:predicted transcriptional regulator